MKCSHDGLAVLLDNLGLDDEGNPVVARRLASLQPEHRETSGETGHTTEYGLEGLGVMVGDEVFEDLDSRNP